MNIAHIGSHSTALVGKKILTDFRKIARDNFLHMVVQNKTLRGLKFQILILSDALRSRGVKRWISTVSDFDILMPDAYFASEIG